MSNIDVLKELEFNDNTATAINPRLMSDDYGSPYFTQNPKTRASEMLNVLDNTWTRRAFLIPGVDLSTSNGGKDKILRYWTSASTKFTSNMVGCNIGVNARPGFTPYADPPARNLLSSEPCRLNQPNISNLPLGRFYSEAIDDPSQTIYLRFGVPSYSSILRYFATAFDYNALAMVRSGSMSISYTVGEAFGLVTMFRAFPLLMAGLIGLKHINSLFNFASSKFYTLKPTMHIYWATVNRLVNIIAVNKGFIPRWEDRETQVMGTPWKLDKTDLTAFASMINDDVFTGEWGFDCFAIANKAQRRAIKWNDAMRKELDGGDPNLFSGLINKIDDPNLVLSHSELNNAFGKSQNIKRWYDRIKSGGETIKLMYSPDKADSSPSDANDPSVWADREDFYKKYKESSMKDGFWDYLSSEFDDGEGWVVFKVDYTGPMSESFSNSVSPNSMLSMVNSVSNTVRDFRFGLNSVMEAVPGVKPVAEMVNDAIAGTLGQWTFGMTSLIYGMGVGFIDVPKFWNESSASLNNGTRYSMQLVSPYGNTYSQMVNQIIPLCMLIAGGLPRSTGAQSHGSPFICQLFDRGRAQIRVGMITELTITRGTTNLGYSKLGCPMGLEVSFKVEDLSSNMSCPLASGTAFSNTLGTISAGQLGTTPFMDEDNPMNDYLAVLAGMDVYTQIYPAPKAKLRFAQTYMNSWQEMNSSAAWASWTHDVFTSGAMSLFGQGLKAFYTGTKIVPS